MNNTKMLNLYSINAALLILHEIDSAFWKEWDLFGLPGGIELFLILNFFLIYFVLLGLKYIASGNSRGFYFALFLSVSGIVAFLLHTGYMLTGHTEFRTVMSIIILLLFFVFSLLLGRVAIQYRRRHE
jgi:uncharacterized protein involved in response to NO